MLYNLDWLKKGKKFPPASELERLQTYRDNRALFHGRMSEVFQPYRERIRRIVEQFAEREGFTSHSFDSFELELNYFQKVTLKMGDLVAGEPPTITAKNTESGIKIDEALENTDAEFDTKLLEIVYDVSRFGDSVGRLAVDAKTKNADVIINSPDIWFPIVSYENNKKIEYHVLAWIECENSNEDVLKRDYVLKVQIHSKGYYDAYEYALKDYKEITNAVASDGSNTRIPSGVIGDLLDGPHRVQTGFSDFAIVSFHNVRTSDSCFGINDYDSICSLIAELQVRYSLEDLILDKHSCPTIHGPSSALKPDNTGRWIFPTGGVVPVDSNESPPGYMIWDASLAANHAQIERIEKHLYSLSELGAVIDDDSFGASQGQEALETRMTNAKLKARRLSSRLTPSVKKLIALLLSKQGINLKPSEISIFWNDGLPNNEYRETDIASKKLQSGLMDLETILMDHFNKSADEAAAIAEKVRAATKNTFVDFNDIEEDDGANEPT